MQKIEKKLKIFEQNARDLRDYDAKYPNKLTRVGLLHTPPESQGPLPSWCHALYLDADPCTVVMVSWYLKPASMQDLQHSCRCPLQKAVMWMVVL